MNGKSKRIISLLLILALSLALGFLIDFLWQLTEKSAHPQDYSELIEKYSKEYNIPGDVIYATIKVESDFDPEAISSAGAIGLMQIMPSTFEWLTGDEHLGEHLSSNKLFDPEVNIRYGTYYLKYLYTKFDHNWDTVAAAYNGGEGNVAKWLADERYSDGNGNITDFPDKFSETENYVKKIAREREHYQELYFEK